MPRCGSGSVPIAIGWKCTNCRRTHRSSIPRSAFGNTRARPELTTGTSQPPRNWSAPCHGSSERCNSILNRSDPICFLFADRDVPLLMRGCIVVQRDSGYVPTSEMTLLACCLSLTFAEMAGLLWPRLSLTDQLVLADGQNLPGYSIAIRQNFYRKEFGTTKSPSRNRILPLPMTLAEAL